MRDEQLAALLTQARKKGSDARFRAWVRTQKSCISGKFSEWLDAQGFNPACHIRRAGASGTGHKAEYACVPMTHEEHDCQHRHGEAAVLNKYLHWGEFRREEAKDWFDRQRLRYVRMWLAS